MVRVGVDVSPQGLVRSRTPRPPKTTRWVFEPCARRLSQPVVRVYRISRYCNTGEGWAKRGRCQQCGCMLPKHTVQRQRPCADHTAPSLMASSIMASRTVQVLSCNRGRLLIRDANRTVLLPPRRPCCTTTIIVPRASLIHCTCAYTSWPLQSDTPV